MKILYVIDTLETGGAEQSLLEISSRLTRNAAVVCHLYKGAALKQKFEMARIPVFSLDLTGNYNFLEAYRKLKAVCESEKPDLIVSALYRSEIISRLVARSMNIPQIGSFVSDSYSGNKKATFSAFGRLKFKFFYWLNRITANRATAYVANSESIRQSNSRALGVPPGKIHVIYRGRQVKEISRLNSTGEQIKFLNVGRLIRGKGQRELIHAFARFIKTQPGSTLTIAGEGPFRTELEADVQKLELGNAVKLLGNVEHVSELYQNHDCLVFPSHYEGFSGVLVEAMLSKIPVLASDIPMNKEAVTHLQTGYIFEVKNEDAILEAMNWFAANRTVATEISERAFAEARIRFDIHAIVKQHEDLYQAIVMNATTR